jgi:hypothetical protein
VSKSKDANAKDVGELINVAAGQRRRGRHAYSSGVAAHSTVFWFVLSVCVMLAAFEAYRVCTFFVDLTAARSGLLSLRDDLSLDSLQDSEEQVLATREKLDRARDRAGDARQFVDSDPLLLAARHLPFVGKQARGLIGLVQAAQVAAETGTRASDVALAFARQTDDPDQT